MKTTLRSTGSLLPIFCLGLLLLAAAGCGSCPMMGSGCRLLAASPGDDWVRSELYFGMRVNQDQVIADEQWTAFLDQQITPRFMDGLTVYDAYGQMLMPTGELVKERTRVVVILYPLSMAEQANQKINAIAAAFHSQFQAVSVLRADSIARTSFIEGAAVAASAGAQTR